MKENANIGFNRSYVRRSRLTAGMSASSQAAAPPMCDLLKREWPSRRSAVRRAALHINVDHKCLKTHDQFEGKKKKKKKSIAAESPKLPQLKYWGPRGKRSMTTPAAGA